MQSGQILRDGNFWFLRYYRAEMKNGRAVRVRVSEKLARYGDAYRSKRDVRPLAEAILRPLNDGFQQPESSLTLTQFIENHFLPHIQTKVDAGFKKPSTHK